VLGVDKRVLANLYFFLEKTAKNGLTLNEVEAMHEILSALKKLELQMQSQNEKGVRTDD